MTFDFTKDTLKSITHTYDYYAETKKKIYQNVHMKNTDTKYNEEKKKQHKEKHGTKNIVLRHVNLLKRIRNIRLNIFKNNKIKMKYI